MNRFDASNQSHSNNSTPWKLESAASSHCAGKNAHVFDPQPVSNGITVGCANGSTMNKTKTGKLPFTNMPAGAQKANVFKTVPLLLVGCAPLVERGCCGIINTPAAQVINKATGNVLLAADFEPWSAAWNVDPRKQKKTLNQLM